MMYGRKDLVIVGISFTFICYRMHFKCSNWIFLLIFSQHPSSFSHFHTQQFFGRTTPTITFVQFGFCLSEQCIHFSWWFTRDQNSSIYFSSARKSTARNKVQTFEINGKIIVFCLYQRKFNWQLTSTIKRKRKMSTVASAPRHFLDGLTWVHCIFCLKQFSRAQQFLVFSCHAIACHDCAKKCK